MCFLIIKKEQQKISISLYHIPITSTDTTLTKTMCDVCGEKIKMQFNNVEFKS